MRSAQKSPAGVGSALHVEALRVVATLADLRDGDVDGADAGVQVAVCRYPLRLLTRSLEGLPYSAPQTASASADNNALIIVDSRCHIRSGAASARASSSTPAGSTYEVRLSRCSVRERCEGFTRRIAWLPHFDSSRRSRRPRYSTIRDATAGRTARANFAGLATGALRITHD
jgi:hypothetical protein